MQGMKGRGMVIIWMDRASYNRDQDQRRGYFSLVGGDLRSTLKVGWKAGSYTTTPTTTSGLQRRRQELLWRYTTRVELRKGDEELRILQNCSPLISEYIHFDKVYDIIYIYCISVSFFSVIDTLINVTPCTLGKIILPVNFLFIERINAHNCQVWV